MKYLHRVWNTEIILIDLFSQDQKFLSPAVLKILGFKKKNDFGCKLYLNSFNLLKKNTVIALFAHKKIINVLFLSRRKQLWHSKKCHSVL